MLLVSVSTFFLYTLLYTVRYDKLIDYYYVCIDADKLAHVVYEPGSKALEEISKEFGKDILDDSDNTQIDRKKLGAIVFSDAASMSVRLYLHMCSLTSIGLCVCIFLMFYHCNNMYLNQYHNHNHISRIITLET